ncbi:sensory box protein [Francisella tularensis subsp. novicida U112]|nr:PAS domain-containing protein [Francisella tularensis]AJI61065.1 sensory box protein [Francisella tularensis subsp. novicida U112]APC95289.1 sensory box protein [Francisella tularensis subsp. novicida]
MKPELKTFINVAEAISKLLHPFAEVVIHDLSKNKIVAIFNPISKREVGDISYLDYINLDVYNEAIIGPYDKVNYDGRKMKCIITVIKNSTNDIIGTLCINLDVSVFDRYQNLINAFLNNNDMQISQQQQSLFRDTFYEKINSFVQKYCLDNNLTLDNLTRDQKKDLILELKQQGALDRKNASKYIANALNISRATVYNYLK